jgi:hypothetical protein
MGEGLPSLATDADTDDLVENVDLRLVQPIAGLALAE